MIKKSTDIVIVENITADFGVKRNAKLTPIFKLQEVSKTGIQSCLYTVTLTPIFCINFLSLLEALVLIINLNVAVNVFTYSVFCIAF